MKTNVALYIIVIRRTKPGQDNSSKVDCIEHHKIFWTNPPGSAHSTSAQTLGLVTQAPAGLMTQGLPSEINDAALCYAKAIDDIQKALLKN